MMNMDVVTRARQILQRCNEDDELSLAWEREHNRDTPITSHRYLALRKWNVTPDQAMLLAQLDVTQERRAATGLDR